jgi:hypothetical protein
MTTLLYFLALIPLVYCDVVIVVSPSGVDAPFCGSAAAVACASLKYAVETVTLGFELDVNVVVRLESGLYLSESCNTTVTRSLVVEGAATVQLARQT